MVGLENGELCSHNILESERDDMEIKQIQLTDPRHVPNLSPEIIICKGKAAAVCLQNVGKQTGVELQVTGSIVNTIGLNWFELAECDFNSYADSQETTEWGAEAIAFIVVNEFTEYQVIKRSYKGTGFDYMLADKECKLFQGTQAKLEVSGIQNLKNPSDLKSRVNQKVTQASQKFKNLPVLVIVTAFSTPKAEVSHVAGN